MIIVRFFKAVFSIYALLMLVATFFITFPTYFFVFNFFSKEKAPHIAHTVSRYWAHLLLFLFFIRVKVKNKDLIDKNETYVMVSNHQSQLDILVSAVASSNIFRFLAKAELTMLPVMGYVIKRLYIPVQRSSKTDRTRSLDNLKKSLKEHISVFIYPEGTRNKSDQPLLDFYDGAFRLAVESQTPIAVLSIKDSGKLLSPKGMLNLSPGFIHCSWTEPIPTKGKTIEDIPMLKELVRDKLIQGLI